MRLWPGLGSGFAAVQSCSGASPFRGVCGRNRDAPGPPALGPRFIGIQWLVKAQTFPALSLVSNNLYVEHIIPVCQEPCLIAVGNVTLSFNFPFVKQFAVEMGTV